MSFTQLLIGYSVFSAAILLLAYVFFLRDVRKTRTSLVSCTALLVAVAGLQMCHLLYWQAGFEPVSSRAYALLVLLAPPAFFFFSREVLLPDTQHSRRELLHLLPLFLGLFIVPGFVLPAAFVIGAGYTVWFARIVFGMRRHVRRFRFEMFFFGLFALMALTILIVVALIPLVGPALFYTIYANAIGISLLLIVTALIVFPDILSDISDVAGLAYAKTTLTDVDIDATLARLDVLMDKDKLFQDENLNLRMLADALDLSGHQLSELINRHKGTGFSRYIRARRVQEAQRLLREDAAASVLSIGLMTGFKSQSSFYSAFRETTGQSPGAYRKACQNA